MKGLTVAELIEALKQEDGNALVAIGAGENGCTIPKTGFVEHGFMKDVPGVSPVHIEQEIDTYLVILLHRSR